MDIKEIQELIRKAEIEKAKAEGQQESIKKEWLKEYGTDDPKEIGKKLETLTKRKKELEEIREEEFNTLLESVDWETLKEVL